MFVYDGNARTITEVVVGAPVSVIHDVRRDLWSRGQDYLSENLWSTIPWFRSGGDSRGLDENGNETFQNADYTLNGAEGWRIVLADYAHESLFLGNVLSNNNKIFDYSNATVAGAYPVLRGAADLLSYVVNGDGEAVAVTDADIQRFAAVVNDRCIPTLHAVLEESKPLIGSVSAELLGGINAQKWGGVFSEGLIGGLENSKVQGSVCR